MMKATALKFKNGGKVSVTEARNLAHDYLYRLEQIEELERKLRSITGGENVKVNLYGKAGRIESFRSRDGTYPPSHNLLQETREILRDGLSINYAPYTTSDVITGSDIQVSRFLKINANLTKVIQSAYDEGFEDGSALLRGLANGTMSITDYNEQKTPA
jgi:hypothetical protein